MDLSSKEMKPSEMEGAPARLIAKTLSAAGLRPTRQRLALAALLFSGSDRHVTAERLLMKLLRRDFRYRLLPSTTHFTNSPPQAFLREIAVDGAKFTSTPMLANIIISSMRTLANCLILMTA